MRITLTSTPTYVGENRELRAELRRVHTAQLETIVSQLEDVTVTPEEYCECVRPNMQR